MILKRRCQLALTRITHQVSRAFRLESGISNLVRTGKSVVGDAGGRSAGAGIEYFLGERKGYTEEKIMKLMIE